MVIFQKKHIFIDIILLSNLIKDIIINLVQLFHNLVGRCFAQGMGINSAMRRANGKAAGARTCGAWQRWSGKPEKTNRRGI